jgi:DNA-binding transcriptional MocR family regulator
MAVLTIDPMSINQGAINSARYCRKEGAFRKALRLLRYGYGYVTAALALRLLRYGRGGMEYPPNRNGTLRTLDRNVPPIGILSN